MDSPNKSEEPFFLHLCSTKIDPTLLSFYSEVVFKKV
jgi:hypothetical protein